MTEKQLFVCEALAAAHQRYQSMLVSLGLKLAIDPGTTN